MVTFKFPAEFLTWWTVDALLLLPPSGVATESAQFDNVIRRCRSALALKFGWRLACLLKKKIQKMNAVNQIPEIVFPDTIQIVSR